MSEIVDKKAISKTLEKLVGITFRNGVFFAFYTWWLFLTNQAIAWVDTFSRDGTLRDL